MKIYRMLIKKELRLQKNNFWFLLGAVILAAITMLLGRTSLADIPLYSTTMNSVFMLILVILSNFVLTIVVPVLFGATSIAEEKRLNTAGWQSALPVSIKKEFLVKAVLVITMSVISGGILARLIDFAITDASFYFRMTRGQWPGGFALFMGVVAMFTSSFSREPYRAMIYSAGILGLYSATVLFVDQNLLVFPFGSTGRYVPLTSFSLSNTLMFYLPSAVLVFLAYRNFAGGDTNAKATGIKLIVFTGSVVLLTMFAIDKRVNVFAPANLNWDARSTGFALKTTNEGPVIPRYKPYTFAESFFNGKTIGYLLSSFFTEYPGANPYYSSLNGVTINLSSEPNSNIKVNGTQDSSQTDNILTGFYSIGNGWKDGLVMKLPFRYDIGKQKFSVEKIYFQKNSEISAEAYREEMGSYVLPKTYKSKSAYWQDILLSLPKEDQRRKSLVLGYTEKSTWVGEIDKSSLPNVVTTETLPSSLKEIFQQYGNRFHEVPLVSDVPILQQRFVETSNTVQFLRLYTNQDYQGTKYFENSTVSHDPYHNRGAIVRLETTGTVNLAHVTFIDFDTMKETYMGSMVSNSLPNQSLITATWTSSGKLALLDKYQIAVIDSTPMDKVQFAKSETIGDYFNNYYINYSIRNYKENSVLLYSPNEFVLVVDLNDFLRREVIRGNL